MSFGICDRWRVGTQISHQQWRDWVKRQRALQKIARQDFGELERKRKVDHKSTEEPFTR